jgi:hypothetical protein
MAKKKKKQRQRKPKAPLMPSRFQEGTAVRVKAGTMDEDYPDIPLGGWSGTVVDTERGHRGQPRCQVEWNTYTLQHMPDIYRIRCDRDDLEWEASWFDEEELEPDMGELPTMEQPGELCPQPLDLTYGDDRVRAILGLTTDDVLPVPDMDNLRTYRQYLGERLRFPFEGRSLFADPYSKQAPFEGQVIGLADPAEDTEATGVMAVGLLDQEKVLVPLADLEDTRGGINWQLLQDYGTWFYQDKGEWRLLAYALKQKYGRRAVGFLVKDGLAPIRPAGPGAEGVGRALPPPGPPPDLEGWGRVPAGMRPPLGPPRPPEPLVQSLIRTIGIFAVAGLLLGVMVAAVPGAVFGAVVGGALLGVMGVLILLDPKPVMTNEDRIVFGNRPPSLADLLMMAGFGALLGAGIVTLIVAYVGTLIGAFLGGTLGAIVLNGNKWVWSALVGAVIGGLVLTFIRDPELAWQGAWMGAAWGAGSGLALVLILEAIQRLLRRLSTR